MKKFQAGVVQSSFKPLDVERNISKIESIIENYKRNFPNIQLMLFPELATTGYFLHSSLVSVAEKEDGFSFQKLSSLSKKYNIFLAYGYAEQGDSGKIYNSVKLVGPNGDSLANYRKIHLTPLERDFFEAGSEVVSVETKLGRIGLMICWDLTFPELARILALEGTDLLLVPSAWEVPYNKPYYQFAMARAIDNTVFLATSNHFGLSGNLEFFGESAVYGPDGEIISRAAAYKEDVLVAEIELSRRWECQESFYTMLKERRTDIY